MQCPCSVISWVNYVGFHNDVYLNPKVHSISWIFPVAQWIFRGNYELIMVIVTAYRCWTDNTGQYDEKINENSCIRCWVHLNRQTSILAYNYWWSKCINDGPVGILHTYSISLSLSNSKNENKFYDAQFMLVWKQYLLSVSEHRSEDCFR